VQDEHRLPRHRPRAPNRRVRVVPRGGRGAASSHSEGSLVSPVDGTAVEGDRHRREPGPTVRGDGGPGSLATSRSSPVPRFARARPLALRLPAAPSAVALPIPTVATGNVIR